MLLCKDGVVRPPRVGACTEERPSKLEGGKYEKYAFCFSRCSGKMLAVTWRGDVLKWVQAAGGAESDAGESSCQRHVLHPNGHRYPSRCKSRALARSLTHPSDQVAYWLRA